jgi:tyrosyl-tRNA synthetase
VGLTDPADEMFGKVMSIPDELMIKYFRLCTAVGVDEVDALAAGLENGSQHPNELKRRLAREIVAVYHSRDEASGAEGAFDRVFKQHQAPQDVPSVEVEFEDEVYLPGLLHELGLAPSSSEGRRLIDGGGVRVDGRPVERKTYSVARAYIEGKVVQVGRRRFARPVARG